MRCQLAGRALASAVKDFPDIEVDKIGFLTNRKAARDLGVTAVPALVYGDQRLSGFVLTKGKIRQFLEQL